MKFSNPRIIPRNHQVEEVLKEAEKNNLKPLNDFLSAIEKPYEFNDKHVKYEIPPPFNNEKYKTFCGT